MGKIKTGQNEYTPFPKLNSNFKMLLSHTRMRTGSDVHRIEDGVEWVEETI